MAGKEAVIKDLLPKSVNRKGHFVKIVSRIFGIVGNILFYAFISCFLCYFILMACGIRSFITMSGSMEPSIHVGSLCFVDTRAEYEDVETGDIITFRVATDALVTHRAISVTEYGIETKGDANDVSDGRSTNKDNFFGITLFTIPYLGYAVALIQQPQNKAILIIIALTCLFIGNVDAVVGRKTNN